MDVYCSETKSPIIEKDLTTPLGVYKLRACDQGVHHLALQGVTDENFDPIALSGTEGGKISEKSKHPIDQALQWLENYFSKGSTLSTKTDTDLPPVCFPTEESTGFERRVWNGLAKNVGFGKTVSYSELGGLAVNNPKASRAVGTAMKKNPVALIVPCHRVIRSDGQIGNYAGGKINKVKKWLLDHEAGNVEAKQMTE